MLITTDEIAELNIFMMFDLSTTQVGIKVHADAAKSTIAAAERLHEKGFLTQVDGGYLTELGYETAQHIQSAIGILRASNLTESA